MFGGRAHPKQHGDNEHEASARRELRRLHARITKLERELEQLRNASATADAAIGSQPPLFDLRDNNAPFAKAWAAEQERDQERTHSFFDNQAVDQRARRWLLKG